MINITVLSEDRMKSYDCVVPHITISVRSPDRFGKHLRLPNNMYRQGSIMLEFHDLDDRVEGTDMEGIHELFSPEHAKKIVAFVQKHISFVDTIIINCEAGISRSAGIAAALSKFYNKDDSYFFKHFIPNRRVYRMILEELHTPLSDLNQYGRFNPGEDEFKEEGGILVTVAKKKPKFID